MLREQINAVQLRIDECDNDIERLEEEVKDIKKDRKALNSAKKRLEVLEEQLNESPVVSL